MVAAAVTLVALLVAAAASAPAHGAEIGPPNAKSSWRARVLAPAVIHVQPSHRSKATGVLRPTAPLADGPTILLVLDYHVDGDEEWAKLLIPRRPNGSAGWVDADLLRFSRNPMRILIDLSERRTTVYRNGVAVYRTRNAIGAPGTPTPTGRFAIAEKVLTPPGGFLGPVVMPTTGYSETLNEYAGGNGRFALHGTSVPGLIGTRASHGCIRHRNDAILRISRLVAPGTPLLIRR
jgi:hypothetical protein